MKQETLLSPISGIVAQIYAKNNDLVSENQLILQIEAMKLFYDVTCGINGRINLIIDEGAFIQEGQELATIIGN
jgi:biotin carboxyl carrier protein